MLSGSGTHAAIEYLHKEPPYKPGDWEHIGLINVSPVVLVAKRDVPANTTVAGVPARVRARV